MGNNSPYRLASTITPSAQRPVGLQIRRGSLVLTALRSKALNHGETGAIHVGMVLKSGKHFSLRQYKTALGEMHSTLLRETARRNDLERCFSVVQRALVLAEADLNQLRSGERRAHYQAMHDELTELPNRRYMHVLLEQALAAQTQDSHGPALIYVDLDHFKAVNDDYGHAVGDQVLRITAARLTSAVRKCDTVVRLGGDEFVCLLHSAVDASSLRILCSKLVETLSSPMQIGVLQLVVRPSIGLAAYRAHYDTADSLLNLADSAMYDAKRHGCGFAFANDLP